jgi:hypothetical protein
MAKRDILKWCIPMQGIEEHVDELEQAARASGKRTSRVNGELRIHDVSVQEANAEQAAIQAKTGKRIAIGLMPAEED